MGRPTKFTPEVRETIIKAIGIGATYKDAAEAAGVEYNTFNEWMKRGAASKSGEFKEFYELIRQAEAAARLKYLTTIAEAARNGDWRAALEYLKRRDRQTWGDNLSIEEKRSAEDERKFSGIPVGLIGPSFFDIYRDIERHRHTEYILKGGRGGLKSSFVSLVIPWLLIDDPKSHALVVRQVKETLRDSVFSQIQWAVDQLGLTDSFKFLTSPLEIEYLPTGQKIYFRGANEPAKIKSIKPPFGYIKILWFEELDQFHGPEAVRNIEQSAIRGGDEAFIFKSFNPPRTAANWANKYCLIPKDTQYQHTSDYRTVPPEWLGRTFLDEAAHLQAVNPKAYEHEYLGIANGNGGQVFENVVIREITDDEIAQFDHVLHGLDWGFTVDPASYGRMHYDAARRKLYIFGEVRSWRKGNEDLYNELVAYGLRPDDLIIADSAEPKSVADFRQFGANCRGAEKGKDSVKYSMRWLQGLTEIVIDPKRAPYHADEFINYEYERTKDGEIISAFPDANNHAIDDVRYATNLIWRQRGQ